MSSRPFSILHLVSSERWTGVADPVVSLAREQSKEGHKVWLACIGGYTFEEQARQSGIEIVTDLTLDRRLYLPNLYKDYRRLRRFVATHDVDIIHSHLLHDNWLAGLALRKLRRPHLLTRTMHRFEWPRSDPLHRWLFRAKTDQIITTSEAMKTRISERLRIAGERVQVVFGGVDLERFHPGVDGRAIREEFAIPADAPVAGIVARLRHGRGHDWLLETIPLALRERPEAHFLIVGRGELKRPLRARIAEMPERDRIHMIGYRSEDLPEAYAAMDCSLFLGQGSEGSCRAILEAMSTGRPVIGARQAGVGEIIEEGRTGALVEFGDAQALATRLVEMLGAPERAREMGRTAREVCERRFTEKQRALDIQSAYNRAWRLKYGEPLPGTD